MGSPLQSQAPVCLSKCLFNHQGPAGVAFGSAPLTHHSYSSKLNSRTEAIRANYLQLQGMTSTAQDHSFLLSFLSHYTYVHL